MLSEHLIKRDLQSSGGFQHIVRHSFLGWVLLTSKLRKTFPIEMAGCSFSHQESIITTENRLCWFGLLDLPREMI